MTLRVRTLPDPPTGWRRLLLRVPIMAYSAGFGWLFGRWLVMVEHVGRRTGKRRRVVLEVVARDASGAVTVASGFGAKADWYRNLLAHPQAQVSTGRRRRPVVARPVPVDDGARVMLAYARRHRRPARRIAAVMGYEVDGGDADFAELGRRLNFLRLEPDDRADSADRP
jgi:deazaflavin-dependent oxidoreductase (nitroreductase family)